MLFSYCKEPYHVFYSFPFLWLSSRYHAWSWTFNYLSSKCPLYDRCIKSLFYLVLFFSFFLNFIPRYVIRSQPGHCFGGCYILKINIVTSKINFNRYGFKHWTVCKKHDQQQNSIPLFLNSKSLWIWSWKWKLWCYLLLFH